MEQRRSTRIPVDTRLILAVPGFGLAPVRACNISSGGACVQIARPALAAGTLVQMVYVVRNGARSCVGTRAPWLYVFPETVAG